MLAQRGLVATPGARLLLHSGGPGSDCCPVSLMASSHLPGRGAAVIPRPCTGEQGHRAVRPAPDP